MASGTSDDESVFDRIHTFFSKPLYRFTAKVAGARDEGHDGRSPHIRRTAVAGNRAAEPYVNGALNGALNGVCPATDWIVMWTRFPAGRGDGDGVDNVGTIVAVKNGATCYILKDKEWRFRSRCCSFALEKARVSTGRHKEGMSGC